MSIEIELAKILLTEKRLLANEQNQDFIIYEFEGFNHNNNLILNYKEKIKEIKLLSNEEKVNFENIIEKIDYKLILFNLQTLFLYFVNKSNIIGNELLIKEINEIPKKIIKLDDDFIKIFENPQINIKLSQLIDCYEFVEYLNYDNILNNVSIKAKNNIEKENLDKLNNYFNSKNEKKLLITKEILGNTVRKFISRYLFGEGFRNFDWNIFQFLQYKNELWDDKII